MMAKMHFTRIGAVALLVSAAPIVADLQQPPAPANPPAYRLNDDQIRSVVQVRVGSTMRER
jgi:hypothetical protein